MAKKRGGPFGPAPHGIADADDYKFRRQRPGVSIVERLRFRGE